ncbi:hypothetical protein AAY473_015958 [Plecturocebus cupreus]
MQGGWGHLGQPANIAHMALLPVESRASHAWHPSPPLRLKPCPGGSLRVTETSKKTLKHSQFNQENLGRAVAKAPTGKRLRQCCRGLPMTRFSPQPGTVSRPLAPTASPPGTFPSPVAPAACGPAERALACCLGWLVLAQGSSSTLAPEVPGGLVSGTSHSETRQAAGAGAYCTFTPNAIPPGGPVPDRFMSPAFTLNANPPGGHVLDCCLRPKFTPNAIPPGGHVPDRFMCPAFTLNAIPPGGHVLDCCLRPKFTPNAIPPGGHGSALDTGTEEGPTMSPGWGVSRRPAMALQLEENSQSLVTQMPWKALGFTTGTPEKQPPQDPFCQPAEGSGTGEGTLQQRGKWHPQAASLFIILQSTHQLPATHGYILTLFFFF